MADHVKVATLAELPPGKAKTVEVKGTTLALFNVDGKVYATSNTCAHRGGPLGEGTLSGTVVTCPWHGFQFDVTSGACTTQPGLRVACNGVRVDGQDIMVEC